MPISLIPGTVDFRRRFTALPLATYQAGETVLAAGSTTGRLLILREGAVAVVKEGVDIATVMEPARLSVNSLRCWISRIRRTYVH